MTHAVRGRRWVAVAAVLLAPLGCDKDGNGLTLEVYDRDRHARVSADGQAIVYYRNDERPGGVVGIYRVGIAGGNVTLLQQAVLAGLDRHPHADSIVFSARATGEAEPSLWLMGLDGGGLRRLGGAALGPHGGLGGGATDHVLTADCRLQTAACMVMAWHGPGWEFLACGPAAS